MSMREELIRGYVEAIHVVAQAQIPTGLPFINIRQQASSTAFPFGEAVLGLDGLVKHAIETLDEGGWVFERDAFEKEGLVEE
jgi:hypothetical protein